MPIKFLSSDFQINFAGDTMGSQNLPQVTTLTDGRFVVVYQTVTPSNDTFDQLYSPDGSVSPGGLGVTFAGDQTQPAVTALLDGTLSVVYTNNYHSNFTADPTGTNISYLHYTIPFSLSPVPIGDFNNGDGHDNLVNPAIVTLSSGRQVVVFERIFTPGSDDDILFNVVSADGTATLFSAGSPQAVAANTSFQADPAVAAIGNTALVVYDDATGTTIGSRNIVARVFDGNSNTFGSQFTIADHSEALTTAKVAALDSHRFVIVYAGSVDLFGRIYDTSAGGSLSAEFTIDQPSPFFVNGEPAVAATADGGFVVTWVVTDGSDFNILARRFDSDGGAMGQAFTVNRLTDGVQQDPTVAVSGVNALFAWSDYGFGRPTDTSPPSVRGQVMSLTTPPDLNDNGVSDILWRSASGGLVAWDMNRNGAIGGSGFVTYGGVVTAPDASYSVAAISDFSGDGKADVLWRNTAGSLIEWLMNGSVITQSSYVTAGGTPVNPDPSWSFLGAGDFNGDGMSDMLWRNASGEIAEWQMNGTVIGGSGDLNAGGGAVFLGTAWSVAGIGDFNGDGKSDIIWRNASGEVAEWQMNGSTIIGSNDLNAGGVATAPAANWSVAGVGDFNADGNADLLWRDSSSGALVEWLMNGSSVIGSGSVTSGGTPVNPDPSWHVVEIGDFNGDARADILWRNDSGALGEWFMKGTAIVGTATPSSGGTAVAPDGSWTVQAKPTDFA